MSSILKSLLFTCKHKKEALTGFSSANPNFSKIAFCVAYLHKVGSLVVSFQAIDEGVWSRCMGILVICNPRNTNLLFQVIVLRKFGLGLDNRGQTVEIYHCRIYSL
jgi:hypothetical protein